MDKVVLTKDEFVKIIAERTDVPSDISKILHYVEGVFTLQSDEDRPAYILEVDLDNMAAEDFVILDDGLKYMKVTAILVPKKTVTYLGEVTPKSLGIKDRIRKMRNAIAELCGVVAKYQEEEDER